MTECARTTTLRARSCWRGPASSCAAYDLTTSAPTSRGEDDDTVRWLTEGHRSEPVRTAAWILENRREWATGGPRRHLGICDASTGVLIGGVEARLEPAPPGTERPVQVNVSYAVFPGWRGRGVAAQAVELLCAWLPEAFGPCVAVLRVAPGNAPSLRVAAACGFELRRTNGEGMLEHERPSSPARRVSQRDRPPDGG